MKTTPSKKQKKQRGRKRTLIACLIFVLIPATLTSLVFALQHDFNSHVIQPTDTSSHSPGSRGSIYDKNLNALAFDIASTAAYVRPQILQDPGLAAEKISVALDLDTSELLPRLTSESGIILLDDTITPGAADRLTHLNLEGVFLTLEHKRHYPYGSRAAHVLGFVDNKQGLDGIEYFYDNVLQGSAGNPASLRNLDIPVDVQVGSKGVDLFLTLDTHVQKLLEDHLTILSRRYGATSAMAAIMEPKTGAMLAITNLPTFDPNRFWKYSDQALRNQIIEPFMPGGFSSFLKQTCFFDKTRRLVNDRTINRKRAEQPSKNLLLAPDKFKRKIDPQDAIFNTELLMSLIEKLSFYETSAFDLPAVASNSLSEGENKKVNGSTGLQLLAGLSSAVTNGRTVTPHVLNMIMDRESGRIYHHKTSVTQPAEDVQEESRQAMAVQTLQHLGKQGLKGDFFLEALLHPEDKAISLYESLATEKQAPENNVTADYLMLGLIGKGDSSLALLIALNNADLALLSENTGHQTLPLAWLDRDFTDKIIHFASTPAATPTLALLQPTQQLHPDKTKKSMNTPVNRAALKIAGTEKMPAVTGKSLRHGLRDLQEYNLKIAIVGSGLIVDQQPSADMMITAGDLCTLRLRND